MQTLVQHPTADGSTTAVPPNGPRVGDFVLGARLARRTLADVYAATHVPTGTPHLVFVLRADVMDDKPLVHRVVTEADTARWMRHGSAAKLESHGTTPEGRCYVAVARPVGRALTELFARGRVSPRGVVRLANPLVEALAEAHALGLVHGRLTPGAVVVTSAADAGGGPRVVLSGLGMSVIGFDPEIAPTDRPYVSPEQLAGRDADARSDVFGLASLIHHALVGAPPAQGGTPAGGSLAAGAPPEVSPALAVLDVARTADPAHRHPTVKAFWEDLLSALVTSAAIAEAPTAHAAQQAAQQGTPIAAPLQARESRRAAPAAVAADAPEARHVPAAPVHAMPHAHAAAHGRNPLVYAAMGGVPVALLLAFLLWPRSESVAAPGDTSVPATAVIDAAAGGTITAQPVTPPEQRVPEPVTSVRARSAAIDEVAEGRRRAPAHTADAEPDEPRVATTTTGMKLPDVRLPVVDGDVRVTAASRTADEMSQRATVRASEFANGNRLRGGNQ